jgi:hypothetical protein
MNFRCLRRNSLMPKVVTTSVQTLLQPFLQLPIYLLAMTTNQTTAPYRRWCIVLCLLWVPTGLPANDAIPKEVTLVVNGKRLVASNVRLSRFDELKLHAQEEILERGESKGVIVVITNQRIICYGLISGWRDLKKQAGENVESLLVEDFAAFITTDSRLLNFNGQSGLWGKRDRRTER